MPKKRKTRKEKILHDQKRMAVHEIAPSSVSSAEKEAQQAPSGQTATGTFSLPHVPAAPVKESPKSQPITIATNEYGYLATDLMRTALLTGAIVFAELLIKIMFRV